MKVNEDLPFQLSVTWYQKSKRALMLHYHNLLRNILNDSLQREEDLTWRMCYLGKVPPTFDRAGKESALSLSLSVTRSMLSVLPSIVKPCYKDQHCPYLLNFLFLYESPTDDKGTLTLCCYKRSRTR
jgi:hypothetical protein